MTLAAARSVRGGSGCGLRGRRACKRQAVRQVSGFWLATLLVPADAVVAHLSKCFRCP